MLKGDGEALNGDGKVLNGAGKAVKGDEESLKGEHKTLNDYGKALRQWGGVEVCWISLWGWVVSVKNNGALLKGDREALNGDWDVKG